MDHIHQAAVESQRDLLAGQAGAEGDGRLAERDLTVFRRLPVDLDDGRGRQRLVRPDAALGLRPRESTAPQEHHCRSASVKVIERVRISCPPSRTWTVR
nr:hypothetical protein [Streptomyces sp. TLI_235]